MTERNSAHRRISTLLAQAARVRAMRLSRVRSLALDLSGPLATIAAVSVPPIPIRVARESQSEAIGVLLSAQSVVAGLAVATMVFVLEFSRRESRTSAEGLGRVLTATQREAAIDRFEALTGPRRALIAMLSSVAASTVAFVVVQPAGGAWKLGPPGLSNLPVAVLINFLVILLSAGLFFERARRWSRPSQQRRIHATVLGEAAITAAESYASRLREAAERARTDNVQAIGLLFFSPPPERELGGVVRLCAEWMGEAILRGTSSEFEEAIDLLKTLTLTAVDTLVANDVTFEPPTEAAHWPPLTEIANRIFDVQRRAVDTAQNDYTHALLGFSYWTCVQGIRRKNGGLFQAGIMQFQSLAFAAISGGKDSASPILHRLWMDLTEAFANNVSRPGTREPRSLDLEDESDRQYVNELARCYERQLSMCLNAGDMVSAQEIVSAQEALDHRLSLWSQPRRRGESANAVDELRRRRRVAHLALGFKACDDHLGGKVDVPYQGFLAFVRTHYRDLQTLCRDVSWVLTDESLEWWFLWHEWESEHLPARGGAIDPRRYVLGGFMLRALELISADAILQFDGNASTVANSVERAAGRYSSYADEAPDNASELLARAMRDAVASDERRAAETVANAKLDQGLVADAVAGVLEARYRESVVEPLFREAGRWELANELPLGVNTRGRSMGIPKSAFVLGEHRSHLLGLEDTGFELERDCVERWFDTLARDHRPTRRRLANLDQFERAAREGLGALTPTHPVIVLDGDWIDVLFPTASNASSFQMDRRDRTSRFYEGTLDGTPVVTTLRPGRRQLAVVDLARWGCVTRHCSRGSEIDVRIEEMDADTLARGLADARQRGLDELALGAERLRIRSLAKFSLWECVAFTVKDPAAAVVFRDRA